MATTYESRLIAATTTQLWEIITNFQQASRWNHAWERVEYLGERREGVDTVFRAYNEEGLGHSFRVSEWVHREYVAFEPLAGEPDPEERPYLITLESQAIRLAEAGEGGTEVAFFSTARGHGLRGWFASRFVWPSYQRHGLRSALDNLQRMFQPELFEDEEDEDVEMEVLEGEEER
jgi:hypothetical protein